MIRTSPVLTFFKLARISQNILAHFSTKHQVHEIKNNSMLVVSSAQLPYMSEIQTSSGAKGVVLKIQDNGRSYIGMYSRVEDSGLRQIEISNVNKSWKSTLNQLIQQVQNNKFHGAYDVNGQRIDTSIKSRQSEKSQTEQPQFIINGNKRRLQSASLILNSCYDLYYGDMIAFMGCRGSQKSKNASAIAQQFEKHKDSVIIYVNPYYKQTLSLLQSTQKTIVFTVPNSQQPTDIGVYMMTIKAINLSVQLKSKGKNVLLIVDNLNDIMLRQWNLLQTIKFNSKILDSSKLFQYNTLKISPISILNQIYSNCSDDIKSSYLKGKSGSLTSILISQKQGSELVQQISSYSNNLKHLQTLAQVIMFPLDLKVNTNNYLQKPKEGQPEDSTLHQKQIYQYIRKSINRYLKQKDQTELKRSLYKNELRDAPWDYFYLLDSQWWVKGLKQMIFQQTKQVNSFLYWISYNISKDLSGQWTISAKQSYIKFQNYLKIHQSSINQQIIEQFIQQAKLQGWINPFKKDYLS